MGTHLERLGGFAAFALAVAFAVALALAFVVALEDLLRVCDFGAASAFVLALCTLGGPGTPRRVPSPDKHLPLFAWARCSPRQGIRKRRRLRRLVGRSHIWRRRGGQFALAALRAKRLERQALKLSQQFDGGRWRG